MYAVAAKQTTRTTIQHIETLFFFFKFHGVRPGGRRKRPCQTLAPCSRDDCWLCNNSGMLLVTHQSLLSHIPGPRKAHSLRPCSVCRALRTVVECTIIYDTISTVLRYCCTYDVIVLWDKKNKASLDLLAKCTSNVKRNEERKRASPGSLRRILGTTPQHWYSSIPGLPPALPPRLASSSQVPVDKHLKKHNTKKSPKACGLTSLRLNL